MEREQWLIDHGASVADVMEDDLGREFIYIVDEDGSKTKIFMPFFED